MLSALGCIAVVVIVFGIAAIIALLSGAVGVFLGILVAGVVIVGIVKGLLFADTIDAIDRKLHDKDDDY